MNIKQLETIDRSEDLKIDTSEQRHMVGAQPEETCPIIDKAVNCVGKVMDALHGYERIEDTEELKKILSYIEIELSNAVGYRGNGLLEDIRERVKEIRSWGQDWKMTALKYHEQITQEVSHPNQPAI
jgi:hypothetical protein